MDAALANAIARKEELAREMAEIDVFLRLHAKFSGTKRDQGEPEFRGAVNPYRSSASTGVIVAPPAIMPGGRARPGRVRPADFADISARLIREQGRPLSRSELATLIEANDVVIPSEDKARYIGTILWRNKERFINVGKGYQLAELMSEQERLEARVVAQIEGADDDVSEPPTSAVPLQRTHEQVEAELKAAGVIPVHANLVRAPGPHS